MKTKTLLLLFLLILSQISFAQQETNWWYFGSNAGISFTGSGGSPVAQTNGKLNTSEGVASISNAKGDLLFYTDGETVYNKQHSVMTNGTGLNGNSSSTQSAVIVQQPVRGNRYYIFTADENWYTKGFQYSIVDTSASSGNGQVVSKNTKLLNSCAEKVSATLHSNKVDIWVAAHSGGDNKFYVYKLSSTGVGSPVISSVGPTWTNTGSGSIGYAKGYLKFSPDGTKLVAAIAGMQGGSGAYSANAGRIEIYDFDNVTGVVSNHQIIDKNNIPSGVGTISSVYGIEFSPNSRLLYTSFYMPSYISSGSDGNDGLWQLDLSSGNANAIGASCVKVISSFSTNSGGGMQLGPDGKIYLARGRLTGGAGFLSCIEKPNCKGSGCTFVDNALSLSGKTGRWGIPNFITSFLSKPEFLWGINPSSLCQNEYTRFFVPDSAGFDSAVWNFGDPNSGKLNTGKGFSPYHVFSNPTTFTVFLALYRKTSNTTCIADTGRKKVTIFSYPKPNLGRDTVVCQGQEVILSDNTSGASYVWSDTTNLPAHSAKTKGWHWVDVKVGGCTKRDSMYLDVIPLPKFSLGKDTTFCNGDSIKLTAKDGQIFLWNNGKTTSSIFTKDTGLVWVKASNGNCSTSDTIKLKKAFIYADFNIDNPAQCYNSNVFNFSDASFFIGDTWKQSVYYFYDASTVNAANAKRTFPNAGTYTIRMISQSKLGCKDSISKTVKVYPQTKVEFTIKDSIECLKGNSFDFINTTKDTGTITYAWDLGDKTFATNKDVKGKTYAKDTIYKVKLVSTAVNNCKDSLIKNAKVFPNPKPNFTWDKTCKLIPTQFQYTGSKPINSFLWTFDTENNSSQENPSKTFNTTGVKKIRLFVVNQYNCGDSSVKYFTIKEQSKADFRADDVCEHDSVFFINKSKDALKYSWKFGDGKTSTVKSPKYLYKISGSSQTFNVTLVADSLNGCMDSISKGITVNALPNSNFSYTTSGKQVNFTAAQSGNTKYRWLFGDGDSSNSVNPTHTYKTFLSNMVICLKVINAAGCISETCKQPWAGINLISNSFFKIYPNPNDGKFIIEIDNPEKDISVEIYNSIGELVEKVGMVGKISNINLEVSSGIYLVKMINGDMVYSQKVSVVK